MYICKSCGQTYSEPVKFCGKCGSDSFDIQQAYAPQPVYPNPAPTYSYVPTPAPSGESIAPAIVGMVFGTMSTILAFYMLVYIGVLIDVSSRYFSDEILGMFFGWSVFVLPLAIVGLVMSFKSLSRLKGMSIAGRITSFISLGLWFITFIMTMGNM